MSEQSASESRSARLAAIRQRYTLRDRLHAEYAHDSRWQTGEAIEEVNSELSADIPWLLGELTRLEGMLRAILAISDREVSLTDLDADTIAGLCLWALAGDEETRHEA